MTALQLAANRRRIDIRETGECAPFCHVCKTENEPLQMCVACGDRHFCASNSRQCARCGDAYCERHSIELLDENRFCESCLLAKFEPQMELGLSAELAGRTA